LHNGNTQTHSDILLERIIKRLIALHCNQ